MQLNFCCLNVVWKARQLYVHNCTSLRVNRNMFFPNFLFLYNVAILLWIRRRQYCGKLFRFSLACFLGIYSKTYIHIYIYILDLTWLGMYLVCVDTRRLALGNMLFIRSSTFSLLCILVRLLCVLLLLLSLWCGWVTCVVCLFDLVVPEWKYLCSSCEFNEYTRIRDWIR